MSTMRLVIASRILAGFASNPAVFAPSDSCGWFLVNCTDADIVGYSLKLADELMQAEEAVPPTKNEPHP